MKSKYLCLAALVFAFALSLPVFAQTAQPERATVAELRELRAKIENQAELSDDLRAQIIELHEAAIAALETGENNHAAALAFERDRRGIDRMMADLKAELDRQVSAPPLTLPDNPTVAQAEDAATRQRSLRAANVTALREQQRLADDRAATRADISRRLGELDLTLELLNRDLRAQVDSSARLELKTAARLHVLARLEEATSEIEMLRARLALLADRSALIPLSTDLAQRRVAISEERVELHIQKAHQLRIEEARTLLTRVQDLSRRVAADLPQLADLAAETEEFAEILWGEDGIVTVSERTAEDLAATRNHQAQLNRISELTVRKFDAYGHRGSVQRWWPDIPDGFPEVGAIARILQDLDEEIPEVEHKLISVEELRASAHELGRRTIRDLRDELGEALTPELEHQVQTLFSARQDILDRLIQRGGRYSNQLVEYRTVAGNFLAQIEIVERFLFTHILWSRSVPRPNIPRIRDIAAALGWMFSTEHLQSFSITGVDLRGDLLFTLLVLILIVAMRRILIGQRNRLAERVSDPEHDSLGLTVRVMLVSGLLAAPLPLALYIIGLLIDRAGDSAYWIASAKAWFELAMVAALLESIRQIFAPRGLAEVHFGWPTTATRPLHRGLLVTEALGLPLLYVALHLAFAGMRLDSSAALQLHNNTLGRLAFIAALLVFGTAILSMLRPEKKTEPADNDMRVPWPRRFAEYAFPTAFLGAYPIIIFATIVPVTLAALGYYLTGLLLAYQMLRTLLLATVVLVGGGLIHRSRTIRRNRMLLAAEDEDESETKLRELEVVEKQTRHLFRFAIVGVLTIGLFSIWSDALPMLQLLKRVQLLPRIELLEATGDPLAVLGAVKEAGEPSAPQKTDGGAESHESTTPIPIPGSPPPAAAGTVPDASQPLTLWLLLEAILAAAITVILVRNLPGVIEITLKRRTTLDGGARFAFSALARYSITIIGTIAVFGLLGVTWGKVQWLAAALTFG
ncbi:MAG: hypothetical protein DRQ45_03400, partial [Gammaproteobacteria bacterium]